jgi:hypothetical protein
VEKKPASESQAQEVSRGGPGEPPGFKEQRQSQVCREKEDKMDAVTIGKGILTWNGHERRCDRYGYVWLMEYGDSESPHKAAPITGKKLNGRFGTLTARVLEARKSTHIGDLFHRVFPRTPEKGAEIRLGEGFLCFDKDEDHESVGLRPADGRDTMWLDIRSLYDVHEQTVELIFTPQN